MVQAQIFDWVLEKEHTEWQQLIYALVKDGKIDPWDIDVSVLVQEYLKVLNDLKTMNFKMSGNVILAATVLIKLKMSRLGLTEFLSITNELENYNSEQDIGFSDFEEDPEMLEQNNSLLKEIGATGSIIKKKMPGPRMRKVTVFELVEALKKAVDVEERRSFRLAEINQNVRKIDIEIPKTTIFDRIQSVYDKLKEIFSGKKETILFEDFVKSKNKKDIVWTILPLLHLCNDGAIELKQKEAFGPIEILLGETEWVQKIPEEKLPEKKAKSKNNKSKRSKTKKEKK